MFLTREQPGEPETWAKEFDRLLSRVNELERQLELMAGRSWQDPIGLATYEDLCVLSGYRNKKRICEWLAVNNYDFDIRKDDMPNVLVKQIHDRQCKSKPARNTPNWAALEKLG